MSSKDDIKRLIIRYTRHKQKLEEQKATLGLNTPPHILTEIEDIEKKLEILEETLEDEKVLSPQSKSNVSKSRLLIGGIIALTLCLVLGLCAGSLNFFINGGDLLAKATATTFQTLTDISIPAPTVTDNSSVELSPPTVTSVNTEEPTQLLTSTQPPTSVNPGESLTPTPTIVPTLTAISASLPTNTPLPPPPPTNTPTNTPLPSPTNTPTPIPMPTNTSVPPPPTCPTPTATHKLLTYLTSNNNLWVDAREECATASSNDRPASCKNVASDDSDGPGSILLGQFFGAEQFIYSVKSQETPMDGKAWAIKFFWKVTPDYFKNAGSHFTEAPPREWLVLNEPNTNNPAYFSVIFLQPGIETAQFQEECSTQDYSIISVIGYINYPNLQNMVVKLN